MPDTRRTQIRPAAQRPCLACPWRTANQGEPHPLGWYTARNLARLWAGMRRGEDMTCHPTDPDNPVPEGARGAPEGAATLECAGSLILRQREVMRYQEIQLAHPHEDGVRLYRQRHPGGLTKAGLLAVVQRYMFGGTPLTGFAMTRPDLNEPGISAPGTAPWNPPEGGDDPCLSGTPTGPGGP